VSLRPNASTIPAYLTVSALQMPQIPFPSYIMCISVGQLSGEIGFIAMSLVYGMEFLMSFISDLEDTRSDHPPDLLTFLVIIHLAVQSSVRSIPIPNILKTIMRDATYYFLVIFTSHIVIIMFLTLAKVSTSSRS